jgi:4-amino-4-deoxy-L-arabinose transferase-like glycosyltransferase
MSSRNASRFKAAGMIADRRLSASSQVARSHGSAAAPTFLTMLNQLRRRLAVAPAGPSTSIPTSAPRAATRISPRLRPELAGLLVLAAALNLWALSQNGWANEYYSATVRSMTTSWHNFLFGAFDPAGVMTVDKPPLALWVQAASAKVFGFSSLSMLVPQALMGVAAVALVYDLTRRVFGRPAGFVAGLTLALTPISVAIARHNNPDMLLILCCVAALWFVVRGLADGRTRWLVLAGVMIGLGFETKMAAGLIVVPALAAAWLWAAPGGGFKRLRQLFAGGVAMAVVGLAWPVLVWLTPASSRPWVSGTSDNSIWSLIMDYNGAGRVTGQAGGPGGGMGGPGGGGGGGVFGGPAGVFRLLDSSMGAQAGWLLGFAVVSGIAILIGSRLRRGDARTGWLIATGSAFLACAVVFSAAEGIFHPYYVSLLAPFTAALVGGGVGQFLRSERSTLWLAPVAVVIGGVVELVVLDNTSGAPTWAATLIIITGVVAVAAMVAESSKKVRMAALAVALAGLLAAPASWAAQTVGHATNGTFPAGGPASAGFGGPGGGGRMAGGTQAPPGGANGGTFGGGPGPGGGGGGMFGDNSAALTEALAYARAHGGGTIGVSSQSGAASAIIDSDADVAGIGGFSGRESEVSVAWLQQAVADGKIRYVLVDGSAGMGPQDGRTGASAVMQWVQEHGEQVTDGGLYDLSNLSGTSQEA